MLKFVRNVVLGLLVCLGSATQLLAQTYPMPGSKSEPAVICTGCPGTNTSGQPNDGLPTYPYASPIIDHTGRYVDSVNTASFQNIGIRTVRAGLIRVAPTRRGNAPGRVYIQMGSAIGAYTMDTFFTTKLAGGMTPVSQIMSGVGGFGRTPPEKMLKWEQFLYPEASGTGWYCPFQDGQDRLADFDFDDRGNIVAAYKAVFGWGIVRDDGKTDASHFVTLSQIIAGGGSVDKSKYPKTQEDSSGVAPETIVSIKTGGRYYVITTDQVRSQAVWDVTDPALPRSAGVHSGGNFAMRKWDRDDGTGRVAYVGGDHKLYIYNYADIIGGGSPLVNQTATSGKFTDVAFDESGNLWAAEEADRIWKFSPSGNGYVSTAYTPFGARSFHPNVIHAHNGVLMVAGVDQTSSLFYDVLLLKLEATGPRVMDVDSFFKKYYHVSPLGYAEPGSYRGIQMDVQVVKPSNNKTYVMYSLLGLGDVYEIEGGDSISVKLKSDTFGTVNPNAKSTTTGPFVGDTVTFTAPSSNPLVTFDNTWDFGNPESGSNNQTLKKSNLEVSHQYTGLSSSAVITAAKTVRAVTVQDSAIASQYSLTLKVPTPRIGIANVATPITANATGVEVLAGTTFNDASDGSVEGHFGTWTLDGVPTKLKPNETLPVGAVGPHTLSFYGSYGAYDASFNGTGFYVTPTLTISYTVRPFTVNLNTPTKSGTVVTFGATGQAANDGSITATQWSVQWTKNGAPLVTGGGISTNAATVATIPSVPSQQFDMSALNDGDTIGVTVTVDAAGLTGNAQQYPTASSSMQLSKPNPSIQKSGCDNANSPCTFTAISATGASTAGWTFAWTLKNNGVLAKTGTGNPFSPQITAPGNYTVEVVASKTIFDAPASLAFPVAGSLCAPPPDAVNVTIAKVGCASGCNVGTTVTFWPTFLGYSAQDCDTITWTFGDGGSGTGTEVTHTYSSAGTFTVKMTLTNSAGSVSKTTTVTVSNGSTGGNTCTAPTTASMTYSGNLGCSTGSPCRTTEVVGFSARRGASSLQSCDSVLWTFGDNGSTSTSRTPTHMFPNAGTFAVTLKITNSAGSTQTTQNITITTAPTGGGSCSTAPTFANFSVTYTGASTGCNAINKNPCNANETINFDSPNYYYTVQSCDNFLWNFDDGSTSTERQPTHSFNGSKSSYNVSLTVSNGAGSYTYTRAVPVGGGTPAKPVPVLTGTSFPTTGVKGKAITFKASSNMATTTGWTWTVTPQGGNTVTDASQAGQTKQSSDMTYTFPNKGKYTVKVAARNSEETSTALTASTQVLIDIADAPAIPEYVYLLPVTAHANGQGGSKWRTDVQIYNPDPQVSETKPLVMTAEFKGHTYDLQMIKSTHIYEDFLGILLQFQKDDSGPVIITTKSSMTPPQIWTRTYNQSENGTFGQFIPAIRIDSNAGGGATVAEGNYYLAGLRHDDRYRTNVGFLNPTASAFDATITVYDDRHFGIKQLTRTLQPFQLDQFTLKNVVPELPTDRPFSLEIEIPAGKWVVAYASYIDGVSQDPVFFQATRDTEVASTDFKTTVIPGVGHTGAWRSDVTIFNPDSKGLDFTLQYFDGAGNKVAEAPGQLESYKFIQYGDILKQGILGNVPDGLGTLKIINTSVVPNDIQPMSFARTYNDDGANGTFGQGIAAFSSVRANVKPNKPALLAGVRNSADYYTNIGMLNLAETDTNVTVTLLDPVTGAAASQQTYTLKPNQTLVGQFNSGNWNGIESGTFKIEATANVWAFASVIDKRTKDPEYVPATPAQ